MWSGKRTVGVVLGRAVADGGPRIPSREVLVKLARWVVELSSFERLPGSEYRSCTTFTEIAGLGLAA